MNKVTINTAVRIQMTCMAATYKPISRHGANEGNSSLAQAQGPCTTLADGERHVWLSAGGDGVVATWTWKSTDWPCFNVSACVLRRLNGANATMWSRAPSNGLFAAEGSEVRQFDVHQSPVLALGTTRSGIHASGDANGLLCFWTMEGGRLNVQHACPTPFGKIRHIASHPDGLMLATGSGQVVVMADDGKVVSTVQAHARSAYWAGVHPTKPVTLSTGQDGELVAHDGQQEVLRMPVHKSAVYRARICGKHLWTAGRDHDVKAWDLNSFDAVHKLHMPHTRSVNALARGGVDGTQVATGGDDRSVKVRHASLDDTHHEMGAPPQD